MKRKLKVLFFDIETSPLEVYTWGIWDQKITPDQIKKDWSVLSWSGKWLGESQIYYEDNRNSKAPRDDKELLKGIWELLNTADIVVTQNGKKFDEKKLNARFIINGMKPPSSFRHIDTKQIASRYFAFTSNSLDNLGKDLQLAKKKLKHKKFPGLNLWKECLANNLDAWKEMERYNKRDVIALEQLYDKLAPWDKNHPNFNLYHDDFHNLCNCGSSKLVKNGFKYTSVGRYQRFLCKDCGAESRDSKNLLIKEKRDSLKRK